MWLPPLSCWPLCSCSPRSFTGGRLLRQGLFQAHDKMLRRSQTTDATALCERSTVVRIYWRWPNIRLACCMAKKPEPVDDLLEALVWMRRKAKRHEAVDDLIDALMKMRRKAKKKLANRQLSTNRKHSTNRKRSAKKRTKP